MYAEITLKVAAVATVLMENKNKTKQKSFDILHQHLSKNSVL